MGAKILEAESKVGLALREARLRAGIPQGVLAAAIGVSIWVLNRVEHGTRRFDATWLDRLPEPVRLPVAAMMETRARADYWRARSAARQAPEA